jgi:hypothetical protein
LVGGLANCDIKEVLGVVCKYSKRVTHIPFKKNPTTKKILLMLSYHVFSKHGYPKIIILDRGPQFTCKLWHEELAKMNIEPRWATSRHPQTNGQTERAIQHLIQMIQVSSRNNLSLLRSLPALEYATNNTHKETWGTTSLKVCLNYNPQNPKYANQTELPPADQSQKKEQLKARGKAVSDFINSSRTEMDQPKVGDMVYIRTESIKAPHLLTQLSPQFMGLCKIVSEMGEKN